MVIEIKETGIGFQVTFHMSLSFRSRKTSANFPRQSIPTALATEDAG